MDVIASNISNVNTTGYKASRVQFQELLSQTIRGSSAPRGGTGGLNPIQIGLGMALGGIDTMFTQGSLQDTGRLTDLAIQGNGFFVLRTGEGYGYVRDGNLDVGVDGGMVHLTTGYKVQGWTADANGSIDTGEAVSNINIPLGMRLARATKLTNLSGNLDASADPTDPDQVVNMTVGIYDSLGNQHQVTMTFTKNAANPNQWDWVATPPDVNQDGTPDFIFSSGDTGTIVFKTDGSYNADPDGDGVDNDIYMEVADFQTGAAGAVYNVDPDLDSSIHLDFSSITQLVDLSEVSVANQDGLAPGALTTFSMSNTGEIMGVFSNGLTRRLGQIAMAKFQNSGGLRKEGQSMFNTSANSGVAQIGLPGQDGRGMISSGYLEMSNVELAQQFTSMITAQRGFQANSRVITASDEMLQELVNLTR